MRQYEYRIEKIEFKDKKTPRHEHILGVLNELGQEGWDVCSLSVDQRTAANEGHLSVLLKKRL